MDIQTDQLTRLLREQIEKFDGAVDGFQKRRLPRLRRSDNTKNLVFVDIKTDTLECFFTSILDT